MTTRLASLFHREPWMADAACRGTDPALFHPDKGDTATAQEAMELCEACAVKDECLTWALVHNITDGILGGTSPRQRRKLRSARGLTFTGKPTVRVPAS